MSREEDLIVEFMKAIIISPSYEFSQEDKTKYYDSLNQCFRKEMKFELAAIEAKKYVRALNKELQKP